MAVKFPLTMADGAKVRTIEELREHFDLNTVLTYYDNGRLTKWLENGYYDEEAKKVSALDACSDTLTKELCNILGVDHSEDQTEQVNLGLISEKNKRLEELKQYTVDDTILAAVDRVAFTQNELSALLNRGITEVYLLGKKFVIPEGFERITYHCINNPDPVVVRFAKVEKLKRAAERGDTKAQIELDRVMAVELNDAEAQVRLGDRYYDGYGVDYDEAEAVKWYRKAADRGHADAQMSLGYCYYNGEGVAQNFTEAVKWFKLAAEQGHAEAQTNLGVCYHSGNGVAQDFAEAVKWFRLAADQGHAPAQSHLGNCYDLGQGIAQDYREAVNWYRKAAEQGYAPAQAGLGICYFFGNGVAHDYKEAVKWCKKASDQGYQDTLMELVLEEAP